MERGEQRQVVVMHPPGIDTECRVRRTSAEENHPSAAPHSRESVTPSLDPACAFNYEVGSVATIERAGSPGDAARLVVEVLGGFHGPHQVEAVAAEIVAVRIAGHEAGAAGDARAPVIGFAPGVQTNSLSLSRRPLLPPGQSGLKGVAALSLPYATA